MTPQQHGAEGKADRCTVEVFRVGESEFIPVNSTYLKGAILIR